VSGERSVVSFGYVDVEGGITSLYPVLPGRVAEVLVEENESLKAGAVLFRLDDRLAQLRVQAAQAELDAARAQLADARKLPEQHRSKMAQQQAAILAVQNRLSAARHVRARKETLVKSQQLNAEEAAAAGDLVKELEATERAEQEKLRELELRDPAATITRAEQDVAAKLALLDQAKHALDECEIRAPVDGKVLRLFVSRGEVLGPQPKQPAVQFCPDAPRIVRAEVEQEFAGRVAVGQTAVIHDDTSTGTTWRAKVDRISDWYTHRRSIVQEPLQFNDVRTLECILELDPGQPPLRMWQRVRVTMGK
jgi:multidrug resistance efflux pump